MSCLALWTVAGFVLTFLVPEPLKKKAPPTHRVDGAFNQKVFAVS
jgi:hypothetical protein